MVGVTYISTFLLIELLRYSMIRKSSYMWCGPRPSPDIWTNLAAVQ